MRSTIIIGYGNLDRQDDGVAWHILTGLIAKLGRPAPASPDDLHEESGENPEFLFELQLVPEMSEIIARYERVCFIDAHTGAVPQELNIVQVQAQFQRSPLTHHMTPKTTLSLVNSIYHQQPGALLVSVRGYEFGFSNALSQRTQELATEAVQTIWDWLQQ
jgi:hydrogenase maturation protease